MRDLVNHAWNPYIIRLESIGLYEGSFKSCSESIGLRDGSYTTCLESIGLYEGSCEIYLETMGLTKQSNEADCQFPLFCVARSPSHHCNMSDTCL